MLATLHRFSIQVFAVLTTTLRVCFACPSAVLTDRPLAGVFPGTWARRPALRATAGGGRTTLQADFTAASAGMLMLQREGGIFRGGKTHLDCLSGRGSSMVGGDRGAVGSAAAVTPPFFTSLLP